MEKTAKKNLQQEKESIENELDISKQEFMALKSTVAKGTAEIREIIIELQTTKVVFVSLLKLNRCFCSCFVFSCVMNFFSFLVRMLRPLWALSVISKTDSFTYS